LKPVSEAEAAVLRIAQRETSPQYASEFDPITRGFLVAVIALGALGVMALAYVLWLALVRVFSRVGTRGH
jgi:hypothetical protein